MQYILLFKWKLVLSYAFYEHCLIWMMKISAKTEAYSLKSNKIKRSLFVKIKSSLVFSDKVC